MSAATPGDALSLLRSVAACPIHADAPDAIVFIRDCNACAAEIVEVASWQARNEAAREIWRCLDQIAAANARAKMLETVLREHGRGVAEDGTEYCIYCDWPFGKPWPDDDGIPAQHRPSCVLEGLRTLHVPTLVLQVP